MKLSYDVTTDTLYVELRASPGADAEEITTDFVVDFDDTGAVVGLEIQHASGHVDLSRIETHDLPSATPAGR